ncbi:dihydropteroate synthase [Candidimonas nitroreducens]|uniref:Dihydropteroate synthase n=1 Tax=Candidimonas nitroreducens TaxID=683354 RepID=A0A225MH87_9BURK|nr:dihydropteroate synthase [Candidimonas nitroreducens]OWT60252.1 dihydropteroate synthase [Candidimonas nitroreducens]
MGNSLLCGRFELRLERPLVMGIVNLTPDSFSDGSLYLEADAAIAHARALVTEGADMLDLGAESTRPGAQPVSAENELRRLLPVLEALRDAGVPLSVDTFKPEVMRRVLDAGADMINDIYGFRQPGALQAVAASRCGLCAMHMQGEPRTMQQAPQYGDVVAEVRGFLQERLDALLAAGIEPKRIALDPGFGFGKTAAQNYLLLNRLAELRIGQYPLLLGLSRKSMLGHVIGRQPAERVAASIAAALAAVARGAEILRVHDVAATVDAVKIWKAVELGVSS